ncbi:uncharacterized protein LOC114245378 [Bombyx mandarina]|uniref:Uncharacterized protein LOC114245378 n=1 Tax=Bombyx mandarina TaxID=7092 RepID=A0A6J2JU12_BOMMA|nr:uncharacterized protein LOC114245378 [Bombyx mandarina]
MKVIDECLVCGYNNTSRTRSATINVCKKIINTYGSGCADLLGKLFIWSYLRPMDYDCKEADGQAYRLDPGSAPRQCPKRKHTPNKVMATVWWSSAGIIYHTFLKKLVNLQSSLVLSSSVSSITVSSNGNSPKVKMEGGMMLDKVLPQEMVTVGPVALTSSKKSNYEKSRQLLSNSTTLALNERYRRLIPYMTFYYANDLIVPTTENTKVEVEKAEIVEAQEIGHPVQRQPKNIAYYPHRNIPRYQGNRLTQYNIASANPTKVFYKDGVQVHRPTKVAQNLNPFYDYVNNNFDGGRFIQKYVVKPFNTAPVPQRKPYINLYKNEETPNIRYYLSEKEPETKYKLVPYEQTPPVVVPQRNENVHEVKKTYSPAPVIKEQVFLKHRIVHPESIYNQNVNHQLPVRKQPVLIGNQYRKPHPQPVLPIVENGFRPIVNIPYTTETPIYTSDLSPTFDSIHINENPIEQIQTTSTAPDTEHKQKKYVVDQQVHRLTQTPTNMLTSLVKSLQLNRSIPKPITKDNVESSIRTLLQALNTLKAATKDINVEGPILSTPTPFVTPATILEINSSPVEQEYARPLPVANNYENEDVEFETYLDPVHPPSQHLDDYPLHGSTSQQFPLPVTSDEEGGTPGSPGIDYPILTAIPQTSFNCKTQRYKGFFADTETRCQVWHYCDLNGGQASFLCPNGTIFSQAGLTCDWWFNVRCDSATQLYVLNESLYKFILPHRPKFPEDYSGPLVDKYLTLKFKEMEEQFKKNKNKQNASEKIDADEDENSKASEEDTDDSKSGDANDKLSTVNTASVIVESPGTSGNVERLHE